MKKTKRVFVVVACLLVMFQPAGSALAQQAGASQTLKDKSLQADQRADAADKRADRLLSEMRRQPGPQAQKGFEVWVNCGAPATSNSPFNSITAALAKLDPKGPNMIHVSGACNENVQITSFDRLTLAANPGASINDASGGTLDVLDIADSSRVTIIGFTINGGDTGIACFAYSLCRLSGNTVQGAGGDAVFVGRSRFLSDSDVVQNNGGRGVVLANGSEGILFGTSVQGNGDVGISLVVGSLGILNGVTVQNNNDTGVVAVANSSVRVVGSTITNHAFAGVRLLQSSVARFDLAPSAITNNFIVGVELRDLSFAFFRPGNNVTGNDPLAIGGGDVFCGTQFTATRGALTNINGGITNCTEP